MGIQLSILRDVHANNCNLHSLYVGHMAKEQNFLGANCSCFEGEMCTLMKISQHIVLSHLLI